MSSELTIRLLRPRLPSAHAVLPYLMRMDAARQYANFGPLVCEFEQALSTKVDWGFAAPEVVSMSNCTVAIQLWLLCRGLPPGTKVLVPALTFSATAQAVLSVGMTPVFADVDPNNWLLTVAHAHDALREHRIGAVLPVAAFGSAVDPLPWQTFARDTGIPVLIDAAGAFANQMIAHDVDLAMSFHTTKTLPCGEGGALVTTNKAIAEQLRTASNFGIDRHDGYVKGIGFNTKMSEVHAAYGLASLAVFPEQAAARIALHHHYLASHSADLGVTQQRSSQGIYSIFNLALPAEATIVQGRMAEQGIECRRWYCPPLPQHPFFMDCPRVGKLDVTHHLGERILGLPFHLEMDDRSVATVLQALRASL